MLPVIAEYKLEDYADVWALHQKTISQNAGFVKNLAFHADLHDIPHSYQAFFVLRDQEKIIGMVGVRRITGTELEVKRLQVDPAFQGKGYGKQLMARVFAYAKEQGVSALKLDVSEPQLKARELYLKLGFKITHLEHRTLGPDNEKFVSTFMEMEL